MKKLSPIMYGIKYSSRDLPTGTMSLSLCEQDIMELKVRICQE